MGNSMCACKACAKDEDIKQLTMEGQVGDAPLKRKTIESLQSNMQQGK